MKICTKCGLTKPEDDFWRDSGTNDGLYRWCKPCAKAVHAVWHKANPKNPGYRYGLTREEYAEIVSRPCENPGCGSTESIHLDHDHETGAVRGALCGKCNRALGLLDDDIDRIEGLAKYLGRH